MSQHIYFGENFPDHLPATEKKIIGALLFLLTKHDDITAAVRDEEETALAATTDMAEVASHVGHTGITHLDLADRAGRLGTISLVHGNEEDVVADMGWPSQRPEAEAKLEGFVEHALRVGARVPT